LEFDSAESGAASSRQCFLEGFDAESAPCPMSMPGFSLRFAPTKIEVAKSSDLAYDVGTFELKLNDANGSPTTTMGKYVVVWKKQPDGHWKDADIFNTDK
jgi:ketosteroid isomerase-like protein